MWACGTGRLLMGPAPGLHTELLALAPLLAPKCSRWIRTGTGWLTREEVREALGMLEDDDSDCEELEDILEEVPLHSTLLFA